MIIKLILALYFCFINVINCLDINSGDINSTTNVTTSPKTDFVDLEYIKESNALPGSTFYYIGTTFNLLYKVLNEEESEGSYRGEGYLSRELMSYIPLKNPKILGSFSNNSMFFIGEKWYGDKISIKINDPFFKPIFLIDEQQDKLHHSMVLQDYDNIAIYSMTIKKDGRNSFLAISIDTINIGSTNFNKFINLKDSKTSKLYSSNISIDPLYINTFKFSHDKLNNVYYSLVKEHNSNNTWVIKFENESFTSYLVNINKTITNDFSSILFGAFEDSVIIYKYSNENQTIVSYDLVFNMVTNLYVEKQNCYGFIKIYSKFNNELMFSRHCDDLSSANFGFIYSHFDHAYIVSYSVNNYAIVPYKNIYAFNRASPYNAGSVSQFLIYRKPLNKGKSNISIVVTVLQVIYNIFHGFFK